MDKFLLLLLSNTQQVEDYAQKKFFNITNYVQRELTQLDMP